MNPEIREVERLGFEYLIEIVRRGEVVDREVVHNLVPLEGLNYLAGILLKQVVPATAWFIGLYEGNYTPVTGDTAATFPGSSTESTAYAEATRQAFTSGVVSGGEADNSAAVAQFTCNVAAPATKTLYGGFISSVAAKSAVSGTLLSAVKFASPKVLGNGDVLRITAGLTFVSL